MTMTAEEKKIRRLEKQVADLKVERDELITKVKKFDLDMTYERRWRQDFAHLIKTAMEEELKEYTPVYRYYT